MSLPTHITVRTAQLLTNEAPSGMPTLLCGRQGPFQHVVYEDYMQWRLRELTRMIELEEPNAFHRSIDDTVLYRTFCPDCEARLPAENLRSTILVWLDFVLENGLPPSMESFEPASRKAGERAIDMLQDWLDEAGPQPRKGVEHFLWARAHPGANDEVETQDTAYPYHLRLMRRSRAFWSTNITRLIRQGTLAQNSRGHYISGR